MIKAEAEKGKGTRIEMHVDLFYILEETGNMVHGIVRSLLKDTPPEKRRNVADLLKKMIVIGFKDGMVEAKKDMENAHEAVD